MAKSKENKEDYGSYPCVIRLIQAVKESCAQEKAMAEQIRRLAVRAESLAGGAE